MKETLNLLPGAEGTAAPSKRGAPYYISAGIAFYVALMTILLIFKVIEAKRFDSAIKKLDRQRTELQQKATPHVRVQLAPSVDKEIVNAVEKTPRWSQIIGEISVIVPVDVWLSSIESKEEKGIRLMSIKGFSASQLGVANLISALESSSYFYDVEIVFSQKGEKDISFELRTKLRWT